ncbi:helix-turn-helix domain-containing protein [Clostridium sp. Sa3CUN1]|uniref:Helix-turn-helix domain-containing protein n=1 Tax=Clostridium gallinarum TaxID=2762246 RepID=A0ABR8Q469_9CLOT|nr:helix-turn-helix domain-containing protein [Clostridium gallinarum]MBD7915223.1 helix-turn-helix domain-containing protein [Clostridium gallinarum]
MNVKLARIKAGLTQKELAALIGLSNVTIVKIEKGNYDSLTRATMIKIAKALNSDVQTLFFSEEE